jgi:hypothetical protein
MRRLVLAALVACGSAPSAPVAPSTPPPPVPVVAAPPRFPEVTLPSSNATDVPPVGIPVIVVSKTAIALEGEQALLPLPVDRTHGAAAEFKPNGPNDLMIVPLRDALAKRNAHEGAFAFDASTPYRLFVEVLYTAGQSEIAKFHVLVKNGQTVADLTSTPPRMSTTLSGPSPLSLLVLIVEDGISIKARGGNVAPGCNDVGPGIAFPKKNGDYDLEGLRLCVKRIKEIVPEAADDHAATYSANPKIELRDVVSAIDTVRPFFPEIIYGVAR